MNSVTLRILIQLIIATMIVTSSAEKYDTLPSGVTSNCVRQSLCFHSLDCCIGCCIESQCVEDAGTPCHDADVARNCSTMKCASADEECVQKLRFCPPPSESPCPQPLPECRPRRPMPLEGDGRRGARPDLPPLPVQYPE